MGYKLSHRLSGVGFGRGRKCMEALQRRNERYAGRVVDAKFGKLEDPVASFSRSDKNSQSGYNTAMNWAMLLKLAPTPEK